MSDIEVSESPNYKVSRNTICQLPIGILREGRYCREVELDEWRAIDHEKLSSPAAKDNPTQAMSFVLRRLIQKIDGVLEQKSNPLHLIDERFVNEMFEPDREFLIFQALAVSNADDDAQEYEFNCASCGAENLVSVQLTELEVVPHDHTKPPTFKVKLPRGIKLKDRVITEGTYSYPTGETFSRISKKGRKSGYEVFLDILMAHFKPEDQGSSEGHRLKNLTIEQIRSLPLKDIKALQKAVEESACGVNSEVSCSCYSCGEENSVQIEMSRYFL